ncbi:unnamed protein product, partial [Ceratitis capitata]
MSEDILHRIKTTNQNLNIEFSAAIYDEALIIIEYCQHPIAQRINSDAQREQQFDRNSWLVVLLITNSCLSLSNE